MDDTVITREGLERLIEELDPARRGRSSRDHPLRIRHDPAVVEDEVDVILRGEERAHVALEHEIGRTIRLIVSISSGSAAWIRCQS